MRCHYFITLCPSPLLCPSPVQSALTDSFSTTVSPASKYVLNGAIHANE